jgi:hypothetical protein
MVCNCNGSCSGGCGCGGAGSGGVVGDNVVNGSVGNNLYQPQYPTAVPNYPYGLYNPYYNPYYPPYNPWAPWGGGCCRCRCHPPYPYYNGGIGLAQGQMQCGSHGVLNETKTFVANVTGPLTSGSVQVDPQNPPKGVFYSNGNSDIPTN